MGLIDRKKSKREEKKKKKIRDTRKHNVSTLRIDVKEEKKNRNTVL